MNAFISRSSDLLRSAAGVTATEYAVVLCLIVLVAIVSILALGTTVADTFTVLDNDVVEAAAP